MIITKRHLSRRTVLRGMGTTLALPLLDAMVPAATPLAQTVAVPVRRMSIVYVAHGMVMQQFTPATVGSGFETPLLLQPLERHKQDMVVVSGLSHAMADGQGGPHATGVAAWLTGARPKKTEAEDARAGVSVDQVAAQQLGQSTLFPSLELATEDFTGLVGACEISFSCTYINTLSWSTPTTPLPNEINPRILFERLVGEGGTPEARQARLRQDRSVLDGVSRRLQQLRQRIGPSDRTTLDAYTETVREIERRIRLAESRNASRADLPADAPIGVPDDYAEHCKLMFDLQALAFQADLTRVATFVLSRELTGRAYPNLGVPDPHHSLSHHQNDVAKLEKLVKVQAYQMSFFADYLDKLKATQEGNGSLLDHSMVLYGSALSDSNTHSHHGLPLILAGGAGGRIKGGRHLKAPDDTPMANLLLSMLGKMGVDADEFGDSTGHLNDL